MVNVKWGTRKRDTSNYCDIIDIDNNCFTLYYGKECKKNGWKLKSLTLHHSSPTEVELWVRTLQNYVNGECLYFITLSIGWLITSAVTSKLQCSYHQILNQIMACTIQVGANWSALLVNKRQAQIELFLFRDTVQFMQTILGSGKWENMIPLRSIDHCLIQ